MQSKKIKFTAMYDAVFKKIMSENKDILAKVLETILGSEIKDFKILNNELNKSKINEKGRKVDLLIETEEEYIDIEVNSIYNFHILNGCQIYCASVKKGEKYTSYKKTKVINLIWNKKNKKDIVNGYVKDDDNEIMSDMLLYCEVYIDNFKEKYYNKDVTFIEENKYIIMLGLDSEELTELSKGDEIVSKYKKELEKMESIYLEPLMSEEHDYEMTLKAEREEGKIEGLEQGKLNKQKEIAKQMLKDDADISLISKYTGLTK